MEGVKYVGVTPYEALMKVIRKYYHDKEVSIRKATVSLTQPWENSHIHCEHMPPKTPEEIEKHGHGGFSMLDFKEVCDLFDELKKLGIADIKQTKDLIVTIEVGHVVEVQQTYYIL